MEFYQVSNILCPRRVMKTHLPSTLRVPVKRIFIHNPIVDAVQCELFLLTREDSLRNQRRITIRRFQILGRILAVVDLLGTLHHHAPVIQRRLLCRPRTRGIRRARGRGDLAFEKVRRRRERGLTV